MQSDPGIAEQEWKLCSERGISGGDIYMDRNRLPRGTNAVRVGRPFIPPVWCF